jgi:hypothetical protein
MSLYSYESHLTLSFFFSYKTLFLEQNKLIYDRTYMTTPIRGEAMVLLTSAGFFLFAYTI